MHNCPYNVPLTGPLARGVGEGIRRALAAPPAVGQRTGNFYRDRMLYLPTGASLSTVQSKFAAGGAGTTRCHTAWVGTSIVAGYGSAPGSTDMVAALRGLLLSNYGVVGDLSVMVNGVPAEPDDVRHAYSAGWSFSGGPRIAGVGGGLQLHRRVNTIGQTITFTSDRAGTAVDVYYFGNSVPFQFTIDGGAAQSVTPTGASAVEKTTITGLANTTHTVIVTTTSAANYTYILGIGVRRPTGLDVSNFGYYGAVSNDWRPNGTFFHGYNAVNAVNPDVVLVQLGANECIWGYTTTNLYDDLDAVVSSHKAAGRQVVMIVDPPIESDTITTWTTFRTKIYDVADLRAVPLIDLTESWGSRAQGVANGYYFDQWHPTPAGSAAAAATVFKALTTIA